MSHPYTEFIKTIDDSKYFDLKALSSSEKYEALPFCIRILLESVVRNCDEFEITKTDVLNVVNWPDSSERQAEISFKPARVLLQDFTGVPSLVDLAAMRDALKALGASPEKVNPLIPTDLVVDHSIIADYAGVKDAKAKNEEMEYHRNEERFAFLKWGQLAMKNMRVIPPGAGICHQVNLEFLAHVVMRRDGFLYPDTVVGTDSHTTMVDGLGVLAWGVGGIEAEAVMLGQPIGMLLPEVVGFELTGSLAIGATATDLVLIITNMLRARKVVGKFVEFYGPGCQHLSVADRATITNMSPEYGATAGFFPPDARTLQYLKETGRTKQQVDLCEAYLRAIGIFRTYDNDDNTSKIRYSGASLHLDLNSVCPSVAGPKRPQDHVPLKDLKREFVENLCMPVSFKGFGINEANRDSQVEISIDGDKVALRHGSVVIAAITSCTNTSNPDVLFGAGLLAAKALEKGLATNKLVKCTLSPGSGTVPLYLEAAGLMSPLEKLGFYLAGFGCMTCIGNSGELSDDISNAIKSKDLVAAAVLSGNRNFEGRIHPLTRANYLCSPMLVVAFALAGRVDFDFETEPLVPAKGGNPVFLRDIWPTQAEIRSYVSKFMTEQMFRDVYSKVCDGGDNWARLKATDDKLYNWSKSSYIHHPPYFKNLNAVPAPIQSIERAFCLVHLGDSITTDHISPAGKIALRSPAALYLEEWGISPKDYNSYGARRGNDDVMVRGTFANIRLINKMVDQTGPVTKHIPSGTIAPIYDVAMMYQKTGNPSIILAGHDYGCGSSRDWAAKGPLLQGVRAVIARSYERIHRSNLIGMGILPLEFSQEASPESLGITGLDQMFEIKCAELRPAGSVPVSVLSMDGSILSTFETKCRIDTAIELEYYKHGGILQYVARKLAGKVGSAR